jgi:hypothetical protein
MKILFWNVADPLTEKKERLLQAVAQDHQPAVFCVAEGSHSGPQCQKLIDLFTQLSYRCYYSPLSYRNSKLGFPYKWLATGLKVFVRNDVQVEDLTLGHTRERGRIVVLQTQVHNRKTAVVFLHNMAKSGNRAATDEQVLFLSGLPVLLYGSKLIDQDERVLLIGDFNLEPWDAPMRNEKLLNATFLTKHLQFAQRGSAKGSNYHSPLLEHVIHSKLSNLGGTYYSDTSGWALFDYVLHAGGEQHITYEIITALSSGEELLRTDETLHKSFMTAEIDHLPILVHIHG